MSKGRHNRKKKKHGWRERLRRVLRYRLQIPIKRSTHSPEHIARGVMVGTVWAASPLFGAQMLMVFLTWLGGRKLFNWDFSLINGLAWTWTTNVFTVVPFYYFCYATGHMLLGQSGDISGYNTFEAVFASFTQDDQTLYDSMMLLFGSLWHKVGLPLFAGCLIWSVILGWVAYKLTYGFVIRYREHREHSRRERRQRKASSGGGARHHAQAQSSA
ncbi:MAG: DUF2062 domain-containing protein [Hyphomicrobiales bacterium]